jgi:AcrR family transcriptional regulator
METIPPELVAAAVAEAEQRGQDVVDVPLTAISAAAGISRSTLVRRIGGSRQALDEAVRAAGVDPGGRLPVRDRALDAAAKLISERGLASVTLEAIASAAQCSLPALHGTFGGRDGLLTAIFDRYSATLDLERLMADRPASIEETTRGVYRALVGAFEREHLVLPALFADVCGRPNGPGQRVLAARLPRMFATIGAWLTEEIQAGRIRQLPLPLLVQLLIGPVVLHMLTRPAFTALLGPSFSTVEQACEVFTDTFMRAVIEPTPGKANL